MRKQFKFLRYARPHWRSGIVLLVTMGMSVALDLVQPWPTKVLVDNVLGPHPAPKWLTFLPGADGKHGLLLWVAIAIVAIFLLGTVVSMVNTYASTALGQRVTYDLGADLFLHLQRLSLRFHARRSVGDTIARVTGDPYAVQILVTGAVVEILQAAITLIAMFVIMWQLQPTLTALSFAVVPPLILVIRTLGRPIKGRTRQRRDLEGRMMAIVQQALTAVPAVQAFGREEREHAEFREYADKTVTAYKRSTLAGLWFKLCAGLVTAAGTAVVTYLGARYVLDGKLTLGTLLVFVSYLGSLYGPIDTLAHAASTLQSTAAQADRVFEVLETPIEVKDEPGARDLPVQGTIRYEHVTFGYEPKRPALEEVSVEIRPGEVLAVVGPTGAGKTTLISLLVRFFDPWEGRITIDDTDLREFTLASLRGQIGLVLQEPFIFPYTVAQNISYGRPDASRDEIEASARAANAHDFITRLPEGYDAVVGERGATLSGGEKQRLSIARAFLKDAPVLILDEPTSALDARTEGDLLDALERLMEGRMTLIIAHRLSTIRNANRIIVIDGGRIVEQGMHEELVLAGGLYSSLYRQQMDLAEHVAVDEEELIRSGDDT